MKNICVIGSIGKLGSQLMKHSNTVACPWMFENNASVIDNWFQSNPQIDTVWHVARTCRKVGTRRDHETFLTEQKGMLDLMQTRDDKVGIHNCPEWQTTRQININELDTKRTIYACTKLSNEQIIQKHCSNYKIIRIWDIE